MLYNPFLIRITPCQKQQNSIGTFTQLQRLQKGLTIYLCSQYALISRENWLPTRSLYFWFIYVFHFMVMYGNSQSIVYHFDRCPSHVWSHRRVVAFYVNFITTLRAKIYFEPKAHPFVSELKKGSMKLKFALKFQPQRILPAFRRYMVHWTMEFLTRGFEKHFIHESSLLEKLLLIAISAFFSKRAKPCYVSTRYIVALAYLYNWAKNEAIQKWLSYHFPSYHEVPIPSYYTYSLEDVIS